MIKKIISSLAIFILVTGGILLMASDFMQGRVVSHVSTELIRPEEFERNMEVEAEFDPDAVDAINLEHVLAIMNEELPAIGEIIIPSVGIHLPIIRGMTNETLSAGAGTFRPDQVMGQGNYALASHRMHHPDLLFTPLERIALGDNVYLRGIDNIYIYTVTKIEIVGYYRGDVVEDMVGEGLLTLITCTEDMVDRLKVRGELEQIVSLEDLQESEEFEELLETLPITWETTIETVIIPRPYIEIGLVIAGAVLAGFLAVFISLKRKKGKQVEEVVT